MNTYNIMCSLNASKYNDDSQNDTIIAKQRNPCKIKSKPICGPKINDLFKYATIKIQTQNDDFDKQVGLVFACNIPFGLIEHKEFTHLIQMLRHGYLPPNRHYLSNFLLDQVHNIVIDESKTIFQDQTVSMGLDR